jgi:Secretion system C-terminal sorting domain
MFKKSTTLFVFLMIFIQSIGQNTFNLDPAVGTRFTVTDKVWPEVVGDGDVCLWNDDKLAAFTITIDDNNEQDIPFWTSMISEYGFHFSWFVITEADPAYNVQDWSLYNNLAALGSQIDGHDDRNWYTNPAEGETNLSDADYLARLQATVTTIDTEVTSGSNKCLTYAYPYGEGNETIARTQFIGIRGTQGILNQSNTVNYLDVNSVSNVHIYGNDTDRDQYILPLLDNVNTLYGTNYYRGWGSTHFHGLDEAGETTTNEFLQYLADKPELWVAGFTEVTQYSQSFATHNLTIDNVSESEIKYTLTDDMLDSAFYFPLTVKIRIDNSWISVTAIQNGEPVDSEIITHNGKKYTLVKTVPDAGQVTIAGVADSDPAIISPSLANQSMVEETTLQIDFSAATIGNDAISFTTSNLPNFGVLTDNGDNTGNIVFSPALLDAGDYQNITVIADNGRSITSQSFNLTVSPDSGGEPTTEYIITPTGDGIISDIVNLEEGTTNPWLNGNDIDGTKVLKVGASASTGGGFTTNAIIPFQLPVRPPGKLVTAANLNVNIAYIRHWISSDIDLYGLPYNASNAIYPSDFYDGTFANVQGTATGLQDGFVVRDVDGNEPVGTLILTDREVNTDSEGDTNLAAYINAQYDTGAVAGDYIFLRLSVDATTGSTSAHYYGISDESTTEAPTLTLEIENILSVDAFDNSSISLYPNPVTEGKLTIALKGFKSENTKLNIYSLTGSLVHSEVVNTNSSSNFETVLNLNAGLYILRITDGIALKTEKLIIQ